VGVFVARHGCAGDKHRWIGDDAARPLDAAGVEQAVALADVLVGAGVRRIATSPTRRCRDTVEPLARRLRLPIEELEALHRSHDGAALVGLITAFDARHTVLCTHGENMSGALTTIRAGSQPVGAGDDDDLLLAKGTAWSVTVDDRGAIVALDHLAPDPLVVCPLH
jgi:phosphohistidine phosphatase SixA